MWEIKEVFQRFVSVANDSGPLIPIPHVSNVWDPDTLWTLVAYAVSFQSRLGVTEGLDVSKPES